MTTHEQALLALAQAYDREDAAQRGEPDPWNLDDPGDIGDSDMWVSERLACAQVAAEAFLSALEASNKRADEAEALAERLKMEARCHAREARTANSTIAEIYRVVTGGTGEPGNWNGAEPVRKAFDTLRVEVERLREAARGSTVVVNTAPEKIRELEAENERLREALAPFAEIAMYDVADSFPDADEYKAQRFSVAPQLTNGLLRAAFEAMQSALTSKEKRDEN